MDIKKNHFSTQKVAKKLHQYVKIKHVSALSI